MDFDTKDILEILASIVALLIAIIGHEIMHGAMAYRYGDTTAKDAGRLTINPIPHIDPIGSIALPLLLYISGAPFLFGWAKPVPVDTNRVIRNGGYGAAINVSLAGIYYNLALAFIASLLYAMLEPADILSAFFVLLCVKLVIFNAVLAVLNAWFIPPLDGSRAVAYLGLMAGNGKIADIMNKIEPYGMFILLGILFIPGVSDIFFAPAMWLIEGLLK